MKKFIALILVLAGSNSFGYSEELRLKSEEILFKTCVELMPVSFQKYKRCVKFHNDKFKSETGWDAVHTALKEAKRKSASKLEVEVFVDVTCAKLPQYKNCTGELFKSFKWILNGAKYSEK